MIFTEIFQKKCEHKHVPIDVEYSYCPDCGQLIENQWYLVRCACCGVKEVAVVKKGQIKPLHNFCHNCGSKNYVIERLEKIDCVNVNYAVLIQAQIESETKEFIQSWVNAAQTVDFSQIQNQEQLFLK